jgi:hypothetical protein
MALDSGGHTMVSAGIDCIVCVLGWNKNEREPSMSKD